MMVPTPVHRPEADARTASRSSLYLSAVVHCDGCSSPVKIRNLSCGGALIEGATNAGPGSFVDLVRGGLAAHAVVAWSAQGRCGLKFSKPIDVSKWRAAPGNAEQQRVDEIVKLVKAGAVPLPARRASAQTIFEKEAESNEALLANLRRASELLNGLGDALAADSELVTRHGSSLQNLDLAMQAITAVEAAVRSRDEFEFEARKAPPGADQRLQQQSI